jgi:hypothetical protein
MDTLSAIGPGPHDRRRASPGRSPLGKRGTSVKTSRKSVTTGRWRQLGVAAAIGAVVLAGLLSQGAAWAAASPAAARGGGSTVPACQFGAYVTNVYDISPADSNFSARFWVWSLCREKAWDPLPGLSFPGAVSLTASNNQYSYGLGDYRHVELLQGQFYQQIDEHNYPFDKQRLVIEITPAENSSALHLVADSQDSTITPGMAVPGWNVAGYQVTAVPERFVGNLGNRLIPPGTGHVKDTVFVDTTISRSDRVGFLKSAVPLWIIFLIAAVSFLRTDCDFDRLEARAGILVGLVFAIVLNMSMVDGNVYSTGVSMLDQLHILTLGFILAGLIVNAHCWRWSLADSGEPEKRLHRIELFRRRSLFVGVAAYAALTALIIALAVAKG